MGSVSFLLLWPFPVPSQENSRLGRLLLHLCSHIQCQSPLAARLTPSARQERCRVHIVRVSLAPWPEPGMVGERTTVVCHPTEGSVLNVSLEQEPFSDLTSAIDLQDSGDVAKTSMPSHSVLCFSLVGPAWLWA